MIFKCIHNEVDSRKLHMKFTQIEPSLDAAFTYTSLLRGKSSLFMDVFDELVKKKCMYLMKIYGIVRIKATKGFH